MFDAEDPGKNGARRNARNRSLLSLGGARETPRHRRSDSTLLALSAEEDDDRLRESAEAAEAHFRRMEQRRRHEEEQALAQRHTARARLERVTHPHSDFPHSDFPGGDFPGGDPDEAAKPSLKNRVLDRLFPLPEPSAAPRQREAVRPAPEAQPAPERPAHREEVPRPSRGMWNELPPQARERRADNGHWRPLIDPTRVVAGIFRAKWLILFTTILGAILGVMVALSTPKKYYAATDLLFDPRDLQIVERDLARGGLPSDATLALIENQVSIITSGTVLTKVVDRLELANDPEFNGEGGSSLGLLASPRTLISVLMNGNGKEDGTARHSIAVNNLAEALSVSRNSKTFIITVGVTTQEADKSALVATTVTDVFLETYGDLQSATAGRANREINERLVSLRKEVEQSERGIADFKSKNDIVDAQGRLITDDEIVRLNEQLSTARARTSELNARAAAARSIGIDQVLGGALPEQIASPVMTELLAQYASVKQQANRLAVRLGPRHPDRQSVEAEVSGARDEIARELRRVIASNQVELQRAVQMEQDLAAQLARLKVQKGDLESERITLRELEREAAAKRSVYEALLLRARETGQQEGLNTANVSIISKASPPLDPVGPSRSSIAIAGMLLGFMAGVGLGAARGAMQGLRETMNDRRGGGVPPEGGGGHVPPRDGAGRRQPGRKPRVDDYEDRSVYDDERYPDEGQGVHARGRNRDGDLLQPTANLAALRDARRYMEDESDAPDMPLDELHHRLRVVRERVERLAGHRAAGGRY